ncbi:MAG TPA: DUF5995 family protein [Polyangiaceae bacterium]|nr:DUF5995 family protein [Polyangiaceae bacterium]
MASPTTIDEVLARLEEIVEGCITTPSAGGYFAALYERVTRSVKRAIAARTFDDNARMQTLDCLFADRFLSAWDAYGNGIAPTRSWKLAFDAMTGTETLVVQHLLLGINAHINLDLGIAAATVAPGVSISGLKDDFFRINAVLTRLVAAIEVALTEVSPRMKTVELFADLEDKLFDFALDRARDGAWAFALKLAATPQEQWPPVIAARDAAVVDVGRAILSPGPLAAPVVAWILGAESPDVALNIQIVGA